MPTPIDAAVARIVAIVERARVEAEEKRRR